MKNFIQKVKIKIIFLWVFLGLLCFFLPFANQSLQAQQSPQPMQREQLNQEISNLFRRSSQGMRRSDSLTLPSTQKCATPLLKQALRHRELLDPENQFIFHRPTEPPSDHHDPYYGNVLVKPYDSPSGHFRLYYTEDNYYGDAVDRSDGDSGTVPDYVRRFASYFDASWSYLMGHLGYRAPGGRTEVFILGINYYGVTSADDKGLYIMVKNSYRGYEIKVNRQEPLNTTSGKAEGAMKITAVHEFFHVVQAGYDQWPTSPVDNTWWEENTAVWIEDELYNNVDDYLNYLGWPYEDLNDNGQWDDDSWGNSGEPYYNIYGTRKTNSSRGDGWFDYPDDSLTAVYDDPYDFKTPVHDWEGSSFGYFEYGGVIWAKFLSERFEPGIIRTIFEHASAPSYDILLAIDQSLKDASGGSTPFAQAFIQFKLANLKQDYTEGLNYPRPQHDANVSSQSSQQLDPLCCRYLIEPYSPGKAVRIAFSNKSPADLVALAVPAGSYTSLPESSPVFGAARLIALDKNKEGTYDFSFDENPSYSKLVIIPINLSWNNTASYKLTVQTLGTPPPAPQMGAPTPMFKDGYLAVRLGWEPVRETGRYQIWRGKEGGAYQTMAFQSEEIASPYQDCNSCEDDDHALDEDQSYLYQVKFATSTGTSSSETVSVTTLKLPFHNLRAIYKTTSKNFSIELSFQVDQNISVDPNIPAYQIERTIKGTISPPAEPVVLKSRTKITSPDEHIIYDDYQVQGNTTYTYTVTVYDAHDSIFRKDISVELPSKIQLPSTQKEAHGCFIAAVTFMTF